MIVTLELSFYPLTEKYEIEVLRFLDELNKRKSLRIKTTGMSTMIEGDYDELLELLQKKMRPFMAAEQTNVFVAKFLNKSAFDYA
ncbi:MAG: hypothetical protein ACJAU0_001431 [Flavobacteriales bacterium]|jgi:uncharacterized protein YqgV (UPF0045/DUF77 family)